MRAIRRGRRASPATDNRGSRVPSEQHAGLLMGLSVPPVRDCFPPSGHPIRDVLAGPPQQITGPLANEGADLSLTGIDFVPDVFVSGPV
jgi:hypothetical protein